MTRLSLLILNDLGEYFLSQVGSRKDQHTYLSVENVRKKYVGKFPLRQITNALHYLKRRKYVKYKTTRSDKQFVLTAQGAMRYFIHCDFVTKEKLPEGTLSLVVVEATEDKRYIRDFLRRRLTQCGFTKISRGVYAHKQKLSNNLQLYAKLYSAGDSIFYGEFKSRT